MRDRGALFPLVLIGALAALTFWLQSVTSPRSAERSGKARHDPDFIVDNFNVKRFGPEGNLQHTLFATRMQHFPDDDTTLVSSPRVTFHREPPTILSADSARISANGKEVLLSGNVRWQHAGLGTPDTVMSTASLLVLPDDEVARSRDAVTITKGQSIITGNGLAIDNKTSTVKLYGPVRGTIHRRTVQSPS